MMFYKTILVTLLLAVATHAQTVAWHAPVDSYAKLKELFAAPPAEYSTSPFLVWDGEVTESSIDLHMNSFREQGIRSVFIHPRPGMITPYLSDRWFSLVRYTVDKGKQLGMEVWLYDENSYPSGFAGGHVPATMPESFNQGTGLTLHRMSVLKLDAEKKYPLVLKKDGGAYRDITASIGSERGRSGDYYAFELAFYEKRAWHGGFSYVDLIKPGVTEKFIELTMPGYERTLGADLGKRVPGIFTDEPNIIAPGRKDCMRWTPDLFDQFQKRKGYDLRPKVMSLFEDAGDWRKVRHDYYALLLDLFIERWSKPWQRYAQRKKIMWTGHYWEHGWPSPIHGPDNMAMYAFHDVPSIDMLFNQFSEGVNAQFGNVRSVKELSSVANQLGRRRTLSETYGGAGWELRFEDMKRLGDWEYVLGVNLMNQHLAFQTLAGARKHDYPQSFTYHEPWWKLYRSQAEYFARLSLALSSGEQVNRILVLEPTTSAWLHAAISRDNPRMMEIGSSFQHFLNQLEAMQVEYDLGCESIMKDHGKAAQGKLTVGRRAYDLVVLPPGVENLEAATAKLLEVYVKSGGKIVSFVEPPRLVDGVQTRSPLEVARASSLSDSQTKQMLTAKGFELSGTGGKLFHHRRAVSEGQVLFLVNSSLEETTRATVSIEGRGLARLDPLTGKIEPYASRIEGGMLVAEAELPPAGSLLLFASRSASPGAAKPEGRRQETEIAAAGPITIRRLEPNALTLDYCDLKLGGTVEKDIYYYVAAEKVYRHHGFEGGNPWGTAVQYKTSILDRNKFAPDSGFEATFHFEMASGVERSSLRAVSERPALWKVLINGKPVEARKGEWWLDRDFGVYDIGTQTVVGKNAISLVARPMSVHNELEPIYLTGNFGLAAQPSGWKLVPPSPLQTGAWKEQGLPFYSHTVSYEADYRVDKSAGRILVGLGKWHGTVAEVLVNGKSAGIIESQPYETDITALVKPGVNRVGVVVYGSLKNLLGPHHGKINRGLTSPISFRSAPDHTPPGSGYDLEGYGLMEPFRVVTR